jgi:acyl-CoA reductase-like NAD-dependent aldehyde dehydrogenase
MNIINPYNEEVIKVVNSDTFETTLYKVKKLKEGQTSWSRKPVEDRLSVIVRFGELVKTHREELARILTSETGKPIQQALNEIKGAHNRIEHLKANAVKWLQPEVMVEEGPTKEEIRYEPLGVIANISAWNFPYNVGYNVFLYALVAGNAVAYKPSEYATLTGLKFRELLWEAGVPENVFECFVGAWGGGRLAIGC